MEDLKLTRRHLLAALPGLLLLPAGCAKSPSGAMSSPTSGPQIFVTLTLAGSVNPTLYYFVLFNINGHGNIGPVPVVGPPYGNGFAAGAFTNFVEYNSGVPTGANIGYYAVSANLLQTSFLGGPSSQYIVQAQAANNTIAFQIPLSALATSGTPLAQIQDIQVSFVTTNVTPPPSDNLDANKVYGTLQLPGQTGNSFLNIPLETNGTIQPYSYQNTTSNVVYQYINGVAQPVTNFPDAATDADLTVTNFSIQITSG